MNEMKCSKFKGTLLTLDLTLFQAWGPKPKVNEWQLPLGRPKSMYDKEKFKYEFREIRTHNKLNWVPG